MKEKAESYKTCLAQIKAVVDGEPDLTANLANIAAILKAEFDWWWIGFYVVKGDELVLGPFQGPVACTRIGFGKGVCGTSWAQKQSIVVPDVHAFEGHIACSAASNSEIVVPVLKQGTVWMVLDADSTEFNTYDAVDQQYLEEVAAIIATLPA